VGERAADTALRTIDDSTRLTWSECAGEVERLAGGLAGLGIARDRRADSNELTPTMKLNSGVSPRFTAPRSKAFIEIPTKIGVSDARGYGSPIPRH
jgi:hypothetical protein